MEHQPTIPMYSGEIIPEQRYQTEFVEDIFKNRVPDFILASDNPNVHKAYMKMMRIKPDEV